MTIHYFIQALFVLVGILTLSGALLNSDWLLNSRNSQFIVAAAGRKVARILYALLGCLMIGTGIYFFLAVQNL